MGALMIRVGLLVGGSYSTQLEEDWRPGSTWISTPIDYRARHSSEKACFNEF